MTLVEFLTARLDEAQAGWETQRWGEANGCLKPVFHFGQSTPVILTTTTSGLCWSANRNR